MGSDKKMLPECECYERGYSRKYDGEYDRECDEEYEMRDCGHHDHDEKCEHYDYDENWTINYNKTFSVVVDEWDC